MRVSRPQGQSAPPETKAPSRMSSHFFLNSVLDGRPQPPALPFLWRRSRVDYSYPRLGALDPLREGLAGVPGVLVVWSTVGDGRYVYAGQSSDLAEAMTMLMDDPEIQAWGARQLNVTWAPVGVAHRAGVVTFLRETLGTAVPECSLDLRWPLKANARPLAVPLPA